VLPKLMHYRASALFDLYGVKRKSNAPWAAAWT
jgi:hypothetical protein